MPEKDKITWRQFLALSFVALLSPIVRRMPRSLVMLSGGAAWLAPLLAALPCLALVLLLRRCLAKGLGLGQLLELSLGRLPGRALALLCSLWLIFYCGFLLHSAAHRMVSTVYPGVSPRIFIILTAALCLLAAAGPFRALGRLAMLLRPMLLAALAAVAVFALGDCRLQGVLSLTAEDMLPALGSGATVLGTLSPAVYMCFAAHRVEGCGSRGAFALCGLLLLAIVELTVLGCLGVFGTELTVKLNYPFFMLVRDISIFDSLARIEGLIVAVWMAADFQLVSLLLTLACDNFPLSGRSGTWRRLLYAGAALAAAVTALCIPGDILSLGLLSEKIVPMANALFVFLLFPLALLAGRLRGRI